MVDSLQKSVRVGVINYISSPEIGFLKDISGMVNKARTKLIFMFLNPDEVEPTTNKKYSEIMKNLAAIKSFASGIVVPKNYIFPVNSETGYLDPPTTLVTEAHEEGLEVYASGFVNDAQLSYNYSYDPSDEYLRFIDNSQFAVDGFITDFPPTASESIGLQFSLKNLVDILSFDIFLTCFPLRIFTNLTPTIFSGAACFALNNVTKPVSGKLVILYTNFRSRR